MIDKALLKPRLAPLVATMPMFAAASTSAGDTTPVYLLSDLDISQMAQDAGEPQINRSADGGPLSIGGRTFANGVGTRAASRFVVDLNGLALEFSAEVGADDSAGADGGGVVFKVIGDGKTLFESKILRGGDEAESIRVPLADVKRLMLLVEGGGSSCPADWAEAKLIMKRKDPVPVVVPFVPEEAVILTPPPPRGPRVNGARIFGVRPGSPFFYTIPATGDRPMTFAADGLPSGLHLDPQTGCITGCLKEKSVYAVTLRAKNALGEAKRDFRIVVGDRIALTPPMGWNSWNCWGDAVSQEKVLSSARAMLDKGLVQHGWSYVNIDDGWQGRRGGPGLAIQPNAKFPDMKSLGDQIHGMGLRFGIYSSPWKGTYAGHIGSSCDNADGTYEWIEDGDCNGNFRCKNPPEHHGFGKVPFIGQDSKQWAEWGVDYLKYDWAPIDASHTEAMGRALLMSGRDIVYSLSNNADPAGAADWARLSHCWRTTIDIHDSWRSMSRIGFHQDPWTPFAGPGHWPDPDMLVVGKVGWGPTLHPSRLSPNEQYTHISLWCLLSAPLLIGCDLAQLDGFTLSLLTNDEVLDVNQDPLGKPAIRVAQAGETEVWVKDMEDGSKAAGLFNRGYRAAPVAVRWSDLGLTDKQNVRDLWRQKDLGEFPDGFETGVPRHGVVLVRIEPASAQ